MADTCGDCTADEFRSAAAPSRRVSLQRNMRPAALQDEDLPAAFWESLPEDEDNADLAAIRALEAESTPEERAENFKVRDSHWRGSAGYQSHADQKQRKCADRCKATRHSSAESSCESGTLFRKQ